MGYTFMKLSCRAETAKDGVTPEFVRTAFGKRRVGCGGDGTVGTDYVTSEATAAKFLGHFASQYSQQAVAAKPDNVMYVHTAVVKTVCDVVSVVLDN